MIIWERITNKSIKFETVAVSNTKTEFTNKEYWVKPTQIDVPAGQAFFHHSLLLQPASIPYITSLCLQENIPNDAEAIAAVRTITFASDLGFSNIIVEGDSETVIKAFKSEESFASFFGHLVSVFKLIVESFNQISFSHTCRAGNALTHNLVRHVRHVTRYCGWRIFHHIFIMYW